MKLKSSWINIGMLLLTVFAVAMMVDDIEYDSRWDVQDGTLKQVNQNLDAANRKLNDVQHQVNFSAGWMYGVAQQFFLDASKGEKHLPDADLITACALINQADHFALSDTEFVEKEAHYGYLDEIRRECAVKPKTNPETNPKDGKVK